MSHPVFPIHDRHFFDLGTQGDSALADVQDSALEALGSITVAALETIVFGRVFLIGASHTPISEP